MTEMISSGFGSVAGCYVIKTMKRKNNKKNGSVGETIYSCTSTTHSFSMQVGEFIRLLYISNLNGRRIYFSNYK